MKLNDFAPLKLLHNPVKLGNISQYNTAIWCYKSLGFKTAQLHNCTTAQLLINYFDTFNVFAGKYVYFLKFRKVYIMITNGKHLDVKGITKIKIIASKAKGSSETRTQEI